MQQVWIFLGIYFLVLILVSFSRRKKSAESFLLAERNLSSWAAANSLVATAIGGGLILVGGAYVYQFGISAIWFFVGKIIGYMLLTIFAVQLRARFHEKKYFTLADFFLDFHGKKIHKFVAGLIFVIFLGWVLIGFVGGAGIIVALLGVSYPWALGTLVATVLAYIFVGGFKNVVKTDFLQWGALATIFLLFFFKLSKNFDQISAVQWDLFAADPDLIVGFFLVGILFPFAAMEVWQRIFALKKTQKLLPVMFRFSAMYFAFGWVLGMIVMVIRTMDPNLNPEFAIVEGIVKFFPPAFVGLGAVAFFAAVMSSVDSYLFGANATLVHDFLDSKKKFSPEKLEKKMKKSLLAIGITLAVVGFFWKDLVEITLLVSALTAVPAMLVIFSWISRHKISESALLFSGIVGVAAVLVSAGILSIVPILLVIGTFSPVVGLLFWKIFEKIASIFLPKK